MSDMPLGKAFVTIQENNVSEIAGKDVVRLYCESDTGDSCEVLIWLTEKSMGIARASLKACGFDVDGEALETLVHVPNRLAGKRIPVLVEEYGGRVRASILLSSEPSKGRLEQLQLALRAVKKNRESDEEDLPF